MTERPAWMYEQCEKCGYTNKCAACKWFEYDPAHKDERGKTLKGDGWCTNTGKAKYYSCANELIRKGRDRKEWGGTCQHFEPAVIQTDLQLAFDMSGNITQHKM